MHHYSSGPRLPRAASPCNADPATIACRRRKAALEALFARGREDEAAEDAILEQAKVIEAKRRAEASARRPAPVGAQLSATAVLLGAH